MVLFIMSLNAEGARLYSSISHDDQAFLTRAVLDVLLDLLSTNEYNVTVIDVLKDN